MNDKNNEDEEIIQSWSSSEIGLDATIQVLKNSLNILAFFLRGSEMMAEIVIDKKQGMEWDNRSYKEICSFDESVRATLEVLQFYSNQISNASGKIMEIVEEGTKGRKAINMIRECLVDMDEKTAQLLDEKSAYLNDIGEEED